MPHHVRTMAVEIGPDGQPAHFDGAAWVSQDGRHFWNGAAWVPVVKRSGARPSLLLIGIAVFVVAVVGFIAYKTVLSPQPFAGDGVSNAKIDSPTEVEFDYKRSSTCQNLTFEYRFFDGNGKQVDVFHDTTGGKVDGGVKTHFDIKADASQPINSASVRFEANATCHD